jgi:RNA polymerase sigma-70 factor (ECF subfamily)
MSTVPAARWRVVDVDGVRQVYDAVFAEVYRYAARLAGPDRQLAEDLVQEVFVELAQRVCRGEQPEVSVGWFVTAVRHRFVDQLRRRASERSRFDRTMDAPSASDEQSGAELLSGLTDVERLALVMHHVDGCSVREVAAAIGRSRRATESMLARARDRARRMNTEGRR